MPTNCWTLLTILASSTLATVNCQHYSPRSVEALTVGLSQAGYDQTTHSTSVTVTWTVRTRPQYQFVSYRVRCTNVVSDQHNRHWTRLYNEGARSHTITGLTVNTRYTCCVEMNFEDDADRILGCNTITLTGGHTNLPISTSSSETTPTTSTKRAQTSGIEDGIMYTQEDVTGLYVVISLLCVLLALSALGWLVTGLVAYYKIEHYRRDKSTPDVHPNNTHHNPVYNSDFIPSTAPPMSSRRTTTGHHSNLANNGYEYIEIRTDHPSSMGATSPSPTSPLERPLLDTSTHTTGTHTRRQTLDTRYVPDIPTTTGQRSTMQAQSSTANTGIRNQRLGLSNGGHSGVGRASRPATHQASRRDQKQRNGPANNFGLPAHYETMASQSQH